MPNAKFTLSGNPRCGPGCRVASSDFQLKGDDMAMQTERAVLAGGCFLGMQDLIRKLPGVITTRVGYTGGDVPNATYHHHGTPAEAIEITFDPKVTSYRALLEFFFQVHDPTTRNRQGNDAGPQYRSAIFYDSPEQKATAEQVIAKLDAAGLWDRPIVTEVTAASSFYIAEGEHQEYYQRNPYQPYCMMVVQPKVAKFRKHFIGKLKK
jgi:peptide-methionine (S)-S-oxide reductase